MSHQQWIGGPVPHMLNTWMNGDAPVQSLEPPEPEWQLPQWLDITFLNRLDALKSLSQLAGKRVPPTTTDTDSLLSELIAAIAHEVRRLLATMQATLEALRSSTPLGAGDLDRFVEQLSRSAIWITELIGNLSTRVEASDGAMTLDVEPVDVCNWLEQAIALVQPIAEHRGQSILLASPRPSPVVSGDRFWLRQVMLELLTNACRYGAWADTIAVSVIENDEFVSIRVSDHGVGVFPEELDRVFERLVPGTQSSERRLDGQGLGLHIVRKIVERHAGTISIDGAAGHGSTFTVRLPAARATRPHIRRYAAVDRRDDST